MFVVIVSFRAREEFLDEVCREIARNADASAAEPGCLSFTVLRDQEDPRSFVLYERYRDERAFAEAHRATPHFARWKAVERRCVIDGSRSLRTLVPLAGTPAGARGSSEAPGNGVGA
ncbi:antibiotic biosynthesis monooxygenase [Streptomyces sp. DW26H14]|uniref:antibiotic biosynthesis monooxygenase n=1 Tax=Streptomyces sp. DW26H14 TaxID=3435395 RepID=UPI00403E1CC5